MTINNRRSLKDRSFFNLARSRKVTRSAFKVALVVGSLLALINHGGAIVAWSMSGKELLQILLTYAVPYCVSTYSSVKVLQSR